MTTAKKDVLIRDKDSDSRSTVIDGCGDGFSELVDHLLKNGYLTDKQIEYARRVQSKLEDPGPCCRLSKS